MQFIKCSLIASKSLTSLQKVLCVFCTLFLQKQTTSLVSSNVSSLVFSYTFLISTIITCHLVPWVPRPLQFSFLVELRENMQLTIHLFQSSICEHQVETLVLLQYSSFVRYTSESMSTNSLGTCYTTILQYVVVSKYDLR